MRSKWLTGIIGLLILLIIILFIIINFDGIVTQWRNFDNLFHQNNLKIHNNVKINSIIATSANRSVIQSKSEDY